ncbi:head-to-tail connector complex protein [Streptomyces phage Sycamore]|uniref:Head-to-tail connector complex protein n=1 Tax=Streptomyces phage Sycamore TaxID=2767589 RepID=A0A873WDL6_9CAUD|nr:head-to-tail connector complex protein [Streptomyces phage Sycamore]
MTTPILPDVEALVLKALSARLTAVRVVVDLPADWDAASPLVVAHRVGGAAPDARFLDRALMDVQVWHTDRRAASRLAREVRAILVDACRMALSDDEGSLSHFTEVTGPWAPAPGDHANLSRFIATYQLTARPTRKEL